MRQKNVYNFDMIRSENIVNHRNWRKYDFYHRQYKIEIESTHAENFNVYVDMCHVIKFHEQIGQNDCFNFKFDCVI